MTYEERQQLRQLINARKRDALQAVAEGRTGQRNAYWRRYYRENRERIKEQRLAREMA